MEFKKKTIAQKIRQKKRVLKIQGRVLIVDGVGETNAAKVGKANDDNNNAKGKSSFRNVVSIADMILGLLNYVFISFDLDISQLNVDLTCIDKTSFFFLTAAAPPNNTLFVKNLPYNVKDKDLKKVFQKAVSINIPQSKDKSRG